MKKNSPLFEFCIENPVGKSLPADADSFKNTIAAKLVQNQKWLHHPYQIQEQKLKSDGVFTVGLWRSCSTANVVILYTVFFCTWVLCLIGDNAAHKMRLSASQISH